VAVNREDRMLTVFEPPPGGWERLRARRSSATGWAPSWWALATGGAAALAWLAVASGQTELRMPLSGSRLLGERSRGVDLQILDNGHAVAVPSSNPNVRIYMVQSTAATSGNAR
jgi:hypothetical protein